MDVKAVIDALGITQESVQKAVVNHLMTEVFDTHELLQEVTGLFTSKAKELIAEQFPAKLDELREGVFNKTLTEEIIPVDMFGTPIGDKTNIRAEISRRTREYWETTVDKNGRPGKPQGSWDTSGQYKARHKWVFEEVAQEQFGEALKKEATSIVGELKDAIRESTYKKIDAQLNALLPVKSLGDQGKTRRKAAAQ